MVTLYRAVTQVELDDIHAAAGVFRDSPHLSGEKGFFYAVEDALACASEASRAFGTLHWVVSTKVDAEILRRGRVHQAAAEGAGVYLLAADLHLLTPALEIRI